MQTLTLPCGKTAVVRPLNGVAQKIINRALIESTRGVAVEYRDAVLAEVVEKIDDKPAKPIDLLSLKSGSRIRLLIEARRLAYDDELKIDHVCPAVDCGKKSEVTIDLGALVDVPYPTAQGEPLVSLEVCTRKGVKRVFALRWGTGQSERAFHRDRKSDLLGEFDEALPCIASVDGEEMGPRDLIKLPANLLDPARIAARWMIPVHLMAGTEPHEREAAGKVVTDPKRMPFAGTPEFVEVECPECGHRTITRFTGAPDFLARGAMQQLA